MLAIVELKSLLVKELPRIRRFALSLTGNANDADDLVQSLAERMLHKGMKSDVPAVPWFLKVCKNLWIDEVRARDSRDKLHSESGEAPGKETTSPAPSNELDQIFQAMNQLTEEQRQLVELVIVEGFSYAEAAEVLDIPVGTVMSRVARARAKLAELLS